MMQRRFLSFFAAAAIMGAAMAPSGAEAHKLRQSGVAVQVADSDLQVSPGRDWNSLSSKPGKNAETWTLDGEQLNDVTFYGGIAPGKPLVKERSKKRDPLPKFGKTTLLVEIPELLEGTYRTYKDIGAFQITGSEPVKFLDTDGVHFTYQYTDRDQIVRKGEARASIIKGNLYMVTYDAPRLHYFDRNLADFHNLLSGLARK